MKEVYERTPNSTCDYCGKPIYVRPSHKGKYHTCGKVCQTKYKLNKLSIEDVTSLYQKGTTELELSKLCGCSRSVIKRILINNNIYRRSMSDIMYNRYSIMTDEQIKKQTKKANNRCRDMVENKEWHLLYSGEKHPSYKHGLSKTRPYKTERTQAYRSKKLSQTPILTEAEKMKVELYYKISQHLGPDWHVDHIHPISHGGLHHPDNLQIVTKKYNLQKKDKLNFREPETMEVFKI
jgi:5-methylcytosine-specific restriction endonuclease McrA